TPAQECPTSNTGPSIRAIALLVAATSSSKEVSGFWTATTLYPFFCNRGITLDQLEPSAKAPWTSTIFLTPPGSGFVCPIPEKAAVRISTQHIIVFNCLIV